MPTSEPQSAEPTPLRMSVTGPGGERVNASGPQMSGSQLIEDLAADSRPGTYVVSFGIMSDDGHPVSGTIRFTVQGHARAVADRPVKTAGTASGSGHP